MTKTLPLIFTLLQLLFFGLKIVYAAGSAPTQPTFQYLRSDACNADTNWKESQTDGTQVTSIQIYREGNSWSNRLYGFKVNNGGEITPIGLACDDLQLGATLTLNPSDYITSIKTWYLNDDLCQIEFKVSNMTTKIYVTSKYDFNDCSVSGTATFTAQNYFVGFWGRGDLLNDGARCEAECLVAQSFVRSCSTDSITAINVSSFNSGTLTLVLGAIQTKTLSATTGFGLTTCTINYQITMTPAAPCNSLITLSGNTLTFAASDHLANAVVCSIDVKASIGERTPTVWSAATTGTFTYVNPCVTAQMTGSCWQYFSVNLFSIASVSVNAWSDSVTAAKNNGTQICPYTTLYQYVSTATTNQNQTMAAKFIYTNTASTYTIAVAPTLLSEITGTLPSYVITSKMCLSDALSACKTCTTHITVNCAITWIKIQQQTPSGSLSAQTWTISSSTQFTYQLAVDLTTSCGYTPTSWSVVTTSSNNAAAVGNFQTISSTGLFSAGTFTNNTNAGIFNVSVTSVTLNGTVYSTTSNPGISNTPASPNSFQLAVVALADPCLTATVTASSVAAISVLTFQTSAVYSPFTAFTYTLSSMPTTNCGAFTYSVSLALGTAVNTLTTFSLSTGTTGFQVYSGNKNQVGTFTATLTGTLTSYPSRSASRTFTITVVDPCLTTTLTATPTSLNAMSYSVSQVFLTQQAPSFNDAVSTSQGQTLTICGGLTYQINDVPSGGVTALSWPQLQVDQSGLITVATNNAATVGSHTVTLLVKLTNYPTVTLSLSFSLTITACVVNSAKVYQSQSQATPAELINQSYSTNQASGFFLQLSIIQIPACGYTVSGWGVTQTIVTGSPLPTNSLAVDAATGLLTISANLPSTSAGTSTITINSVTINGVAWGSQLTAPSTFQLTVTSPCASTTVYPTTIPAVSIKVWEGSTTTGYNSFPTATLFFSDSASNAASTPGMCAISYSTSITTSATGQSISTFAYSGSQFNIYSNSMLEIGTYTVTVTGVVTQYTTQSASTTFTITVVDPCLTTTLTATPTSLNLMRCSVSQTATCTQQVPRINDAVSSSQSSSQTSIICGGLTYSISVSASSVNPLTASELKVTSSGLIKVSTKNAATVGIHKAALLVALTNYPSVTLNLTMQIEITAKVVTQAQLNQSVSQDTPAAIAAQQIVDLTPTQRLATMNYLIGGSNSPLQLLKYYKITPSSQYNITFKTTQTQGLALQIQNYQVDLQNQFSVQVNDTKFVDTQVQFQVYVTTDLPDQIPNNDLIIKVLFQANKTEQTQESDQESKISVEQKYSFMFKDAGKIKQSNLYELETQKYAAKITSISQTGLVTIKFSRNVFVPQFKQFSSNQNSTQANRILKSDFEGLTLEQFIDNKALKVTQETKLDVQTIEWTCKNFTKDTLALQLKFKNPLEVSSNGYDKISVKILEPSMFILNGMTGYLFTQEDQSTLTALIPPQFPSQTAQVLFTTISTTITNTAPQILALNLLLQIIAKKVISSLFIYYSVLQIILLINLEANVQLPSSVNLLTNTIDGIINLSSLNKQSIGQKLKIPESAFKENSLLQMLSGVSLAILVIVVITGVIMLIKRFNLGEKLKGLIQKIINFVFWNFLIRYFQVAFINMNFSSLISVRTTAILSEKIVSSNILAVSYALVLIVCYILITRPHSYLSLDKTRQQIGNLYQNLDTMYRRKTFYGAIFFIQRILIVLVIAFKPVFSIQFIFIQIILIGKIIYQVSARPYTLWSDARVDFYNSVLLLATEVAFVLNTPFVPDTAVRYQYGIFFDVLIGAVLVCNIIYILFLGIKPVELKYKRYLIRRKKRLDKKVEKLVQQVVQNEEQVSQNQSITELKQQPNKTKEIDAKQNQVVIKTKQQSSKIIEKQGRKNEFAVKTKLWSKQVSKKTEIGSTEQIDKKIRQEASLTVQTKNDDFTRNWDLEKNQCQITILEYPSDQEQERPNIQKKRETKIIGNYPIHKNNTNTQQQQQTIQLQSRQQNTLQLQQRYPNEKFQVEQEQAPQNQQTQSQLSLSEKLFPKYSLEDPKHTQENLKVRELFHQLGRESQNNNKPNQRKQVQDSVLESIEEQKQLNSLKCDDSIGMNFDEEKNQEIQEYQQYVKEAIKAEYRRHIRDRKKKQKASSEALEDENLEQKECRYFVWRQKLPDQIKQAILKANLRQDWFDYDYEKNQIRKASQISYQK